MDDLFRLQYLRASRPRRPFRLYHVHLILSQISCNVINVGKIHRRRIRAKAFFIFRLVRTCSHCPNRLRRGLQGKKQISPPYCYAAKIFHPIPSTILYGSEGKLTILWKPPCPCFVSKPQRWIVLDVYVLTEVASTMATTCSQGPVVVFVFVSPKGNVRKSVSIDSLTFSTLR